MDIDRENSFTLIELLAVIIIIAILFSIAVGLVGLIKDKTKISITEAIVKQIDVAMQAYKADFGYYFVNTNSFQSLSTASDPVNPSNRFRFNLSGYIEPDTEFIKYFDYESLKGRGYIKTESGTNNAYIVDAWGRSLLYRTPNNPLTNGTVNSSMFDIGSLGKDGKYGDNSNNPTDFGKGDDITNFNY